MKIDIFPLGNMSANFYTVTDETTNELFVIDPGDCKETVKELIKKSGATLRYIILTHAHVDHIGAVDALKEMFNAPVVIHENEAAALNDGYINLCSIFRYPSPVSKADISVKDGETLPFGNDNITFIHTPGHTVGSMCIKLGNVLFTGDTIFNLSIGRCDFPGGSFEEIEASIKNKIYTLSGDTVIYPGHGETSTVAYEKENNPFVRG